MVTGKETALSLERDIKKLKKSKGKEYKYVERLSKMSKIPSYEEAEEVLKSYNKDEFHLKHAHTVSGVMGWYAQTHDPENVEFWKLVGLLHDLDFEMYPEEHCVKEQQIMCDLDWDERLIRACACHGYPRHCELAPELFMEKILFAVDELTGLIGAVILMRPSKSVVDLALSSVKKKFKSLNFAAGCSRDIIRQGAKMLDWELDLLIQKTIDAMRFLEENDQK